MTGPEKAGASCAQARGAPMTWRAALGLTAAGALVIALAFFMANGRYTAVRVAEGVLVIVDKFTGSARACYLGSDPVCAPLPERAVR